jgi:hypothetical protein
MTATSELVLRLEAAEHDLAQARQQLLYWWETKHSCPCGARPESPDTHPHVPWCPTGAAVRADVQAALGEEE